PFTRNLAERVAVAYLAVEERAAGRSRLECIENVRWNIRIDVASAGNERHPQFALRWVVEEIANGSRRHGLAPELNRKTNALCENSLLEPRFDKPRRALDCCFDAFSSREPVSTSLENALIKAFFPGRQRAREGQGGRGV